MPLGHHHEGLGICITYDGFQLYHPADNRCAGRGGTAPVNQSDADTAYDSAINGIEQQIFGNAGRKNDCQSIDSQTVYQRDIEGTDEKTESPQIEKADDQHGQGQNQHRQPLGPAGELMDNDRCSRNPSRRYVKRRQEDVEVDCQNSSAHCQ